MSSKVVVKVDNVTKTFKIPTEASNGLKQKLINNLKGKRGYREFTPLENISFEVKEGDFFGIVGRNGSGKSTLLKTIANIYTPTTGDVGVVGKLVPFIELGVGFNPELTGRENVFLNGALLGFSRSEVDSMYESIVEFAEIGEFMDEKLKNYSSGMQVRLAFSIAIKAQGDILLLDEVLAVGDAAFQQKCFDYFEQLKKKKQTVIIVTHDMASVQRFCNKAMIIEGGVIKHIGSPSEVADMYTEDNIERMATHESDKRGIESKHKLQLDIEHSAEIVRLDYSIESTLDSQGLYVGFTLYHNGANIGEMNSLGQTIQNDKIAYSLDTNLLNPGTYEVSGMLFERDTKSPLAALDDRQRFTIKGYDHTRGSGMKLPDGWHF